MSYRARGAVKGVLSPTYEAVTRPVYATSVNRWRNYARHLEPLRGILDPIAEALGYGASSTGDKGEASGGEAGPGRLSRE